MRINNFLIACVCIYVCMWQTYILCIYSTMKYEPMVLRIYKRWTQKQLRNVVDLMWPMDRIKLKLFRFLTDKFKIRIYVCMYPDIDDMYIVILCKHCQISSDTLLFISRQCMIHMIMWDFAKKKNILLHVGIYLCYASIILFSY